MERLWSPWRLAYVTGTVSDDACVFCRAAADSTGQSLVVHRGRTAFVILNLFPYNNGHLMVVPYRHIGSLAEAGEDELTELMALLRIAEVALREVYAPHGLNVGINLGKAAGAGISDHLHVHMLPRWGGDTSFMTVVGETRVLPEDLEQTMARLVPVFARLTINVAAARGRASEDGGQE